MDLDPRTHARRTDPGTSHDAAAQLSQKRTMMRRLLAAYAIGPMTADEASHVCGYTPRDGAWKRVSDLAALGLIEDTDVTRPGRSGRAQMVRRITDDGRATL